MKLRYVNNAKHFPLITTIMYFIILILAPFGLPEELFGLIFIFIVFFIISLLWLIHDITSSKTIIKKGVKKQGYIFRYLDVHVRHPGSNGKTLDYIMDGNIYNITGVNVDEAYFYLCKQLDNYTLTQPDNSVFAVKTFPIDIYEYNNKRYADLDSVKLN